MQNSTIRILKYYPIVFFLVWVWAVWRRGWNWVEPAPIWLVGLQVAVTDLYGLFNALIYGYIVYFHLQEQSETSENAKNVEAEVQTIVDQNKNSSNIIYDEN